jgi:hypothetical protein
MEPGKRQFAKLEGRIHNFADYRFRRKFPPIPSMARPGMIAGFDRGSAGR